MAFAGNTIFFGKTFNQRLLLIAAQDQVYEFDGATWTDRTGAAVDDGIDSRWSGGWLAGGLTLANQKAVRTFKPGIDATTQLMQYDPGTGDTWESKNYSAAAFRPYRNYMLAMNVDWNGVEYPSRVQWCDRVEPGQVPDDWESTDTNKAGDIDLADTPGQIIDAYPLRDALLIYKTDGIFICQWVGGNSVFSFRRLTTAKGIAARNCVVEYSGFHWCQGLEDIFVVDGNLPKSAIEGRIRQTWLKDRDEAKASNNFTALDLTNNEVLFAYVSKNAPSGYTYPDKVLVMDLTSNSWFFRDYDLEMTHAQVTLDVVDQDSANLVFHAIDRTGSRLLDLEAAPDRLGVAVPAYWTRTGLFSDPGHDWVQVDEAKLQISGQDATLKVGGQKALDAPVVWTKDHAVDPTTDYKTDARANENLIAYRVDVATTKQWQASNLLLLVQKAGERG